MNLRPELMPPVLDEARVARLARLAAILDGDRREDLLEEFNREAGTNLAMLDFQGIYGAMDHDVWVRDVLSLPAQKVVPDVTHEELREMIRRVRAAEGEEHEVSFWLGLLEVNLPGANVCDLIYWPKDYVLANLPGANLTHPNGLSPEQVLDLALAAVRVVPRGL